MSSPLMNGGKMEKVLTKSQENNVNGMVDFELRQADRCDRCGAQAFGTAFKDGRNILFCGHHLREHSPALAAQGFHIIDMTHKINERPTDPTSSNF